MLRGWVVGVAAVEQARVGSHHQHFFESLQRRARLDFGHLQQAAVIARHLGDFADQHAARKNPVQSRGGDPITDLHVFSTLQVLHDAAVGEGAGNNAAGATTLYDGVDAAVVIGDQQYARRVRAGGDDLADDARGAEDGKAFADALVLTFVEGEALEQRPGVAAGDLRGLRARI